MTLKGLPLRVAAASVLARLGAAGVPAQTSAPKGGTIGAATPVVGGGSGDTQPADEKSVSYVRSEFRATAEARNRPPEFAEAMVDVDVEIAGGDREGQAPHAHGVPGARAQGGRAGG